MDLYSNIVIIPEKSKGYRGLPIYHFVYTPKNKIVPYHCFNHLEVNKMIKLSSGFRIQKNII